MKLLPWILGAALGAFLGVMVGVAIGRSTHPAHRFVDWPDSGGLILDTKTGQICNPLRNPKPPVPLCYELYKQ